MSTWTKAIWGRRDAAIAIMVGALAGCATSAVAGQSSSDHAGQTVTTQTVANTTTQPTLGRVWGPGGQKGYGQVRPSTIYNGGDESGLAEHIKWASWGGTKAVGYGEAVYVGPGQFEYQGKMEPATIVAFDLGSCAGHPAYLRVEWYFPQHGQKFVASATDRNICTGAITG
jgi:hypothetical protein